MEWRVISKSKTWVAESMTVKYRAKPKTWMAESLNPIPGGELTRDSKTKKSSARMSGAPESPCSSYTPPTFGFQIM